MGTETQEAKTAMDNEARRVGDAFTRQECRDCWQTSEGTRKVLHLKEPGPAEILTLDIGTQAYEIINFCSFKSLSLQYLFEKHLGTNTPSYTKSSIW